MRFIHIAAYKLRFTPNNTKRIYTRKINWLRLLQEIIAVHSENHKKPIHIIRVNVKLRGTHKLPLYFTELKVLHTPVHFCMRWINQRKPSFRFRQSKEGQFVQLTMAMGQLLNRVPSQRWHYKWERTLRNITSGPAYRKLTDGSRRVQRTSGYWGKPKYPQRNTPSATLSTTSPLHWTKPGFMRAETGIKLPELWPHCSVKALVCVFFLSYTYEIEILSLFVHS